MRRDSNDPRNFDAVSEQKNNFVCTCDMSGDPNTVEELMYVGRGMLPHATFSGSVTNCIWL